MARIGAASILGLLLAAAREASAQQPNPPAWPESVKVFGPDTDQNAIKDAVQQAWVKNGGHKPTDHGQFSSSRYAFLFKPGSYSVDIPVGYYTQVLGLGVSPEEVIFDGPQGPHCEEGDQSDMGGALSTFWRGAENFRTKAANMLWAVSQAAPLRRIVADGNINLAQFVPGIGMGYSSGGFVGNVQVHGNLFPGSQQQYCTRNAAVGKWSGGVWNMVFIGTKGAPTTHCSQQGGVAATTVDATPVIAEKPFISVAADGKYSLHVPTVKRNRVGVDFEAGTTYGFEQVFVARDTDSAEAINAQLSQGMHVVLSPGIYHLEAPLQLDHDNQVLLGLGLATLVSAMGTPVVRVGNVNGVRVAGVLLQAGPMDAPSLLEWGDGSHPGDAANPGLLHDVSARVGGPTDPAVQQVRTEVMIRIASGWVIGDNLWLWRADHGVAGLTRNSNNPVRTGLVVTGDNVRMYGLAVEHTLEDQVRWSGDDGATYFFQSELPYDATEEFGTAGYVGYRVHDNVRSHQAFGIGVYHFFRDYPVTVNHGIAAPKWLENSFHSPLAVYLTGKGKMMNVLNDRGGSTGKGASQVQWACQPAPPLPVPASLPPKPSGRLEKPFGAGGAGGLVPPDDKAAEENLSALQREQLRQRGALLSQQQQALGNHNFGVLGEGQAPMQGMERPQWASSKVWGDGQAAGGGGGGGGGFSLPWWVPVLTVQFMLTVLLGAYLFRLRLKKASEEVAAATGLSPSGLSGKRARMMRTPGAAGMSPMSPQGLEAQTPKRNSAAGQDNVWGFLTLLINCVPKTRQQGSRSSWMQPPPPGTPAGSSKTRGRSSRGGIGLSPGGPSARTLQAGSPSFGFSPFGRRSPTWRPEEV